MNVLAPDQRFSPRLGDYLLRIGSAKDVGAARVAGVDDVRIAVTHWSWGYSFQVRRISDGRSLGRVVITDGQFLEVGNALKSGDLMRFDGTVQDAIARCKLFASLES